MRTEAELEQLRADIAAHDRERQEAGQLRAEIERLTTDNEYLKADAEHLTAANTDLRAKVERLTAENERLRAAFGRLMVCGNHLATHHKPNWPAYRLDGLTRDQQCEHALRTLGATPDYDMWVCWSGMMQERDALDQQQAVSSEEGK